MFPPNQLPVVRLSKQEQRERVDVLERLSEFDDLEKEIQLVRKFLLERLNQLPERN
jgi:CRISPR/Cas system-associated endonuclease Cas1